MYFEFEENSGGFLSSIGYEKQKITENVPVNDRQKQILTAIEAKSKITIAQLAQKFNVNEKTIRRDLKTLTELELIERIGSDKTGYGEIIKQI